MPRDLFGRDPKDEAQLTASPESQNSGAMGQDWHNDFTIDRGDEGFGFGPSRNAQGDDKALSDLHPYVQTLSLSDVDSCVALENATFPEHERCSREKVNGQHLLGHIASISSCAWISYLRAARYQCYLLHLLFLGV